MSEEILPKNLQVEIEENLRLLNRDLDFITNPTQNTDSFASEYQFEKYELFVEESKEPGEFLVAFYRSLEVLSRGHPNLLSASPEELEDSFRAIIESAINLGEQSLTQTTD